MVYTFLWRFKNGLMNFHKCYNIYVFNVNESIADIPTELQCLSDLENPSQLPVWKVLMIMSYNCLKFSRYSCFRGQVDCPEGCRYHTASAVYNLVIFFFSICSPNVSFYWYHSPQNSQWQRYSFPNWHSSHVWICIKIGRGVAWRQDNLTRFSELLLIIISFVVIRPWMRSMQKWFRSGKGVKVVCLVELTQLAVCISLLKSARGDTVTV